MEREQAREHWEALNMNMNMDSNEYKNKCVPDQTTNAKLQFLKNNMQWNGWLLDEWCCVPSLPSYCRAAFFFFTTMKWWRFIVRNLNYCHGRNARNYFIFPCDNWRHWIFSKINISSLHKCAESLSHATVHVFIVFKWFPHRSVTQSPIFCQIRLKKPDDQSICHENVFTFDSGT